MGEPTYTIRPLKWKAGYESYWTESLGVVIGLLSLYNRDGTPSGGWLAKIPKRHGHEEKRFVNLQDAKRYVWNLHVRNLQRALKPVKDRPDA